MGQWYELVWGSVMKHSREEERVGLVCTSWFRIQ